MQLPTIARITNWCLLPLLLLSLPAAQAAEPLDWWTESGLVKVMRGDPPGPGRDVRLHAARGETEWAQVILRSPQAATVSLTTSALTTSGGTTLPASALSVHPAVYVQTRLPSGNRFNFPESWPEILPRADQVTLQPGVNQPIYLGAYVPPDARPGLYHATLTCRLTGSTACAVPLRLTVWPLTLPLAPTTRTSYYLWWDGLQTRFGLTPGTQQWRTVMDRFFWFLADHRLCPMSLPVDIRQGQPYLRDPRVNGVRLPYLGTDQELRDTIAFVKRRGWLSRCFYYLNDEPPRRVWPELLASARRLRSFDPLTPTLDTLQPEPELQGAVSLWCPNLEGVQLYPEAIAAARARGEEVWWYTCAVPKAPYPTFLLDDDAIAPRLLFWAQPRYDLTGSLYINTIHWGPEGHDIWQEAAVSPELLANNDGLLLYTGRGRTLADAHPVTGVRLEMIRDGLEDVELLHLLRDQIIAAAARQGHTDGPRLARNHLAALASHVVPDLRHCDRDPRALQRLRLKAARQAITLQRDPSSLAEVLAQKPRPFREGLSAVTFEKFCFALPGTPVVDGKLDDDCWQKAARANRPGLRTTITRFRNLTGRLWPSQETVVHWLHDQDHLYCGFRCGEPDPVRLTPLLGPDTLPAVDRVGVGLMPLGPDGHRAPRWYLVTLDGTRLEGAPDPAPLLPALGLPLAAPTSPRPAGLNAVSAPPQETDVLPWRAAVHRDESGYTVEFAFPRALAGRRSQPPFNLFRYAAPGAETLYMTGRFSHRESPYQFGELVLRR